MSESRRPLIIGLSARMFYPAEGAQGIHSKTLQVLEQSIAHWIMSHNALVVMIPSVVRDGELLRSNIQLNDYINYLDGLVLQGGTDISPLAYGEDPIQPAWSGDPVRDAYELELLYAFMKADKPILGICRGMQLLNVALGGSLYQDLPSQFQGSIAHESPAYDQHCHSVHFTPNGKFSALFPQTDSGKVVSIHHQGIKKLGNHLQVESLSADGLIEAISVQNKSYVVGVQWHPEFHFSNGLELLNCSPIIDAFLECARKTAV